MSYIKRQIKDIPKWLFCPECGYDTSSSKRLITHMQKCGELDESKIESHIEISLNLINIAKELVQSNELENIKYQNTDNIILYLKNKIIPFEFFYERKSSIDFDSIRLYEFFFGFNEDVKNRYVKILYDDFIL